jgi:hypothetical protein
MLNDLYPVRVEDSNEIRLEGEEYLCSGSPGNDCDDELEGSEEMGEHLLGKQTHQFYLPTGTQDKSVPIFYVYTYDRH